MMSFLGKLVPIAIVVVVVAGQASAQEPGDAVWRHDAFDNEDGARVHALSFAIPETDAWLFNAECAEGDEGPSIPVMLALDFGARDNAEEVEVRFRIEDYEATYAGSVAIVSEEYAGIGVELGVDDAFWPALRRGNALDVGIVGEEMRSISLRGSNDPVRRFVDSCSQIFAEPESSAAPAK
ncbi:MAG: hypothetical protein CL534_06260 [Ahrensia sp.]|nr:hypothetical protein [Ahrensia sp.]